MKLAKGNKDVPVAYLVAAGVLIAAIAAYVALVRPLGSKSDALQSQIDDTQVQIESAQRQLAAAERPNNVIKVADLVELAKAMPDETDVATAMLELSATAQAAGVEFTSVQPGAPIPGSGFTRFPLTVSFVGNYYDLTELLYQLRQAVTVRDGVLDARSRLFTIDSLNWHEPDIEQFPIVQADLVISTYIYGVNPALLPTTGGTPGATAPATTALSTTTTPGSTTPGATTTTPGSTVPSTTTTPATTSAETAPQQAAAGATP
jgi:Tfp pilus assembly protein PilO